MSVRTRRKNDVTRNRILKASVDVFAEKGYRDATVQDICRKARANIAAVNYYFGSKEHLYAEALRLAFRRSLEAHPIDGGVSPSAPPEDRLRGSIEATVQRMLDPEGREFDILHKEMANPTGLVSEIVRESVEPIRERMRSIVREIIGPRATEEQVALCQSSIMAQCMHLMMPERRHVRPPGPPPHVHVSPETAARHIYAFSLAGIREVGGRIGAGPAA